MKKGLRTGPKPRVLGMAVAGLVGQARHEGAKGMIGPGLEAHWANLVFGP